MPGQVAIHVLLVTLHKTEFLEAGLEADLVAEDCVAGAKHYLRLAFHRQRYGLVAIVFECAAHAFPWSAVYGDWFDEFDGRCSYGLFL